MAGLAADWRVRLRSGDAAGAIRGAGVLIDARTVLTCAHVVRDPDAVIWVEFVENTRVEPVAARVADGGWLPDLPDGDREDVAVLRLDSPRPQARPASLSTELTAGLAVTVTGYPERFDDGMVLIGTVRGLSGRRVELDARHRREVVRGGFSGAGVWAVPADGGGPVVVGIVVSWRGDLDKPQAQDNVLAFSYMIPVARMAELSSVVSELAHPDAWDRGFDERARRWLADPSGPPVKISVIAREGGRERTLRHLEHLADRVHRPADASRAELVDRLLGGALAFAPGGYPACREWLLGRGTRPAGGLPVAEPGITLLVDGVDEAPSPARLAALLARLAECGVRLLLVFRDSGGPGWREVREMVLEPALFAYVDDLLVRAKEWEARRAREKGMVDAESLRHAAAATADLMARREEITVMVDPTERLGALRVLADRLRATYAEGQG